MDQEWLPIEDFPGYSISDHGFVRSEETGLIIARRFNNRGIVYVGLSRDRQQYSLSLARLVAKAFLPPHPSEAFDTPIHRDGDRVNIHAENLMWRPRWFAVKYHQQFDVYQKSTLPIQELETEACFERPLQAAVAYGLLALEVQTVAWNYTNHANTWDKVWPTGQQFRMV